MNRVLVGFVLLTGCGDVDHEAPYASIAPKTDASPVTVDSPVQLPLGSLSAAIPTGELNTVAMERGPTLTGDVLELYFVSDRPGGIGSSDVSMSTRATVSSAWSAPTLVTTHHIRVCAPTPHRHRGNQPASHAGKVSPGAVRLHSG